MTDRAALRDYVREQTLVEIDDLANDKLNTILNRGVLDIASSFPWPFLSMTTTISTVADQDAYSLPADWMRSAYITRTGKRFRLHATTLAEINDTYGDSIGTADDGRWFYFWGGQLHIVPTPASTEADAYQHYYYRLPNLMNNDTDEPEWLSPYHFVVADYAIVRIWEREEDEEKAAAAKTDYRENLERMARHYLGQADDEPTVWGQESSSWFGARTPRNLPLLDGL